MTELDVPESTGGALVADRLSEFRRRISDNPVRHFLGQLAGVWTFTAASAFDELAVGQTKGATFNVTATDGSVVSVTVVLKGTNDAPTITSGAQSGSATEIADLAAGENVDSHLASGAVTFADVDLTDTHSASFAAQAGGYLGTFSLDPVNQAGDSVGWDFSVADAALDSLAAGQVLTQYYDVTVADGNGGTAVQTVTITITGTNDAPTITSGAQSGSATEIADLAAGENVDSHLASGAVTFADVDLTDTHSASFAAQAGGYLGTFSLDPVNQAGDSVGWDFSVADAALDSLAAGQVLTQYYDVTVDDGNGGTAVQTVTITITGTNDAPTITSGAQSGSATEIADLAAGENVDSHLASGAVTFADVDLTDTHSASFAAQAGGYLGTFSLDPVNQAGDSVGWDFSVADAALDSLAAGQVLTQYYDVTVDDGNGGTAVQTVTITITGTNDAPTITSGAQSGSATEIADLAAGENVDSHLRQRRGHVRRRRSDRHAQRELRGAGWGLSRDVQPRPGQPGRRQRWLGLHGRRCGAGQPGRRPGADAILRRHRRRREWRDRGADRDHHDHRHQ